MQHDHLAHYGVKGMKWGVRRYQNADGSLTSSGRQRYGVQRARTVVGKKARGARDRTVEGVYGIGAKLNPREHKYTVKRALTRQSNEDSLLSEAFVKKALRDGVLSSDPEVIKAIDKNGVLKHKNQKYDNLDDTDIKRFKKYTDAAVYSRTINGYLAIGEPPHVAQKANALKTSISKNKVNDQVVFRSCAMKFSTKGLGKKLDTMGEDGMREMVNDLNRRFKGKSYNENRIYSTSTSPSFAIDTWRKVNPTAAKTYNTYLIINTIDTPGIYADARTSDGRKLVNARSNQEVILAPNKMVYKQIKYDKDRNMFAIYMDAL